MCMTKYSWSVLLLLMLEVALVVDCTNNDDPYSSCKDETVMKKLSSCKEVLVDQGETVFLQCKVYSTNNAWLVPNRSEKINITVNPLIIYIDRGQINPVVDNTSFNFIHNQYGHYDLEISNFTQEQDGTYKCQHVFQNKAGEDIYKVFLKRPPTNLTIHNKKEKHTVLGEVGKNLTLICTVNSGKPTETLQWGRDEKVFNKTTNGVIYYTFTPSLSDHMSSFTCSANSPILEKPLQETVQLNIHYKPVLNLFLSSIKPVEGTSIKICCVSDSNPMTKYVVWTKNESSIKNTTSSQNCMVIQTLHRSDAGVYTCSAVNEIGFSEEGTELHVLYPPNITVSLDRLRNHTELTCIPRGLPNNFSFFQWEHQSEFQEHIRYINSTSNGTLIIYRTENKNLLYQDNGIYICKVSNNIPDVYGQDIQKEEILVLPEAPQILFKNTSRIQFGQFGQDRNMTIYIYRQQEPLTPSLIKADGPIPNLIATNQLTTIEDIIYGVKIKVRVVQLTFTLKSLMEDDFANFTVKVCNRYGCDNTRIQMCSASRPEPPTNLTLSTEGTSRQVKWISGFNGGFMQEFYIEYRSYHTSNWTMIGPINSPNTVLKDLVPGTVYEVRIFARNTAGDSERTNITEIKTSRKTQSKNNQWLLFGNVIGGLSLYFIFSHFVFCFLWRRKNDGVRQTLAENNYDEIELTSFEINEEPRSNVRHDINEQLLNLDLNEPMLGNLSHGINVSWTDNVRHARNDVTIGNMSYDTDEGSAENISRESTEEEASSPSTSPHTSSFVGETDAYDNMYQLLQIEQQETHIYKDLNVLQVNCDDICKAAKKQNEENYENCKIK